MQIGLISCNHFSRWRGPGGLCGRAILNYSWVRRHKGLAGFRLCALEARCRWTRGHSWKEPVSEGCQFRQKWWQTQLAWGLWETQGHLLHKLGKQGRVKGACPFPSCSPLTQWHTLWMVFSGCEALPPPGSRECEATIFSVRPAGQGISTVCNRRGKKPSNF